MSQEKNHTPTSASASAASNSQPDIDNERSQTLANGTDIITRPAFSHLDVVSSPLPGFHPTRAEGTSTAGYLTSAGPGQGTTTAGGHERDVKWTSRASRKRIYAQRPVTIQHNHNIGKSVSGRGEKDHIEKEEKGEVGRDTWGAHLRVHLKRERKRRWRWLGITWMIDVSFWVAFIFTFGSVCWVINAFLLYMPLVSSAPARFNQAAGWAFVGGTAFNLGSYLMVVEALNTGHGLLFGPALEGLIEGRDPALLGLMKRDEKFYWWGRRTWRDLGYFASMTQLCAATVFWISTLTGLPGVIPGFPDDPSTAIVDVFFWTPQVIGGTGFIISSSALMLEEQKAWWKLNPTSLGWQIAVWNLIGSVGFTLCALFGYGAATHSWENYESTLATFWGSWAFLIGSALQLGEVLMREGEHSEEPLETKGV